MCVCNKIKKLHIFHIIGVARNSFIGGLYVKLFIKALFYIVLSWILSFLFAFLIAKVITASGQSMSWYCKPYVLIGLYVVPGMLVMCGIHYWQATHFRVRTLLKYNTVPVRSEDVQNAQFMGV